MAYEECTGLDDMYGNDILWEISKGFLTKERICKETFGVCIYPY